MGGDVTPSFYDMRDPTATERYDGMAFGNNLLRPGEVKAVIYPEDPRSRTKRFIEYDVYVQHRENNTAVTKMYHNCLQVNAFGSLADRVVATLRVDPKQGVTKDSQNVVALGLGAKVTVLCLSGESSEALIIGGIRDERDTDRGRKAKGHHLEFTFNGVAFSINDDGSWTLENQGKTGADGKADPKRDAAGAGTVVKVEASGNWTVQTKDAKQSIVIDHKAGTIRLNAEKKLTLTSDSIDIGQGADEAAVLGDTLVKLLGELLDLLATETHPAPGGSTGPPFNAAQYKKMKVKLKSALSTFIKVKKAKR